MPEPHSIFPLRKSSQHAGAGDTQQQTNKQQNSPSKKRCSQSMTMTYISHAPMGKVTRIHSAQVQVFPHFLEQAIVVPSVVCANGHAVRDARDDVQLLDRDLINLVEHIQRRDIDSVMCVRVLFLCTSFGHMQGSSASPFNWD